MEPREQAGRCAVGWREGSGQGFEDRSRDEEDFFGVEAASTGAMGNGAFEIPGWPAGDGEGDEAGRFRRICGDGAGRRGADSYFGDVVGQEGASSVRCGEGRRPG